ncbi:MAG: TauD/TfdA family dioxygenase [Rhodospirillales bacterium]|nr:TauD/TfdA family dioxygenase [Rhodospirillales bacterium]
MPDSNSQISIDPLTPHIGAEVSNFQIAEPMDQSRFGQIHAALMTHQVLFFRNQEMTLDQQKDFARQFGELHIHPGIPGPEGHPEVIAIHTDENSTRIAGEDWHTDVSCDAAPPLGSILHMHTVPKTGGDTLFASMYAAYEALSEPMQTMLGGLTARHSGEMAYRGRYAYRGVDDADLVYPNNDHPVVRTHPVTKRKSLYVNRIFTEAINGLTPTESDALLQFLYLHISKPEFQVRFRWQPGSVAFWDNRAVQHYAIWDYFPQTRSGYRVTVAGDPPY